MVLLEKINKEENKVFAEIVSLRQLQTELYKQEDCFIDKDLPTPKDLRSSISDVGRKIKKLEQRSYELMLDGAYYTNLDK